MILHEYIDRPYSVHCLKDRVPLFSQYLRYDFTEEIFILDKENRLIPTGGSCLFPHGRSRPWSADPLRKKQEERRSFSRVAFHIDKSTVTLDDSVCHSQPKARSSSLRLCREERLEDKHPRGLVHFDARVFHPDPDVRRFFRFPKYHPHRLAEILFGCHLDLPPIGHGIARVHKQIEEKLVKLVRIGVDAGQSPRTSNRQ